MPVLAGDDEGVARIGQALDAGLPVVVPMPVPLPYVVAGVDPAAVNRAKGRPPDQPTGMVVAEFALVEPHVRLGDEALALARALASGELVNLFLPVADDAPAWFAPSTSRGRVGVTLAWPERFRGLLEHRGHLYLSSGNRTGGEVAGTAPAADEAFAGELLVLDGDAAGDPSTARGSATIIGFASDGSVELVRRGIQDSTYGPAHHTFMADVVRRARARGLPRP